VVLAAGGEAPGGGGGGGGPAGGTGPLMVGRVAYASQIPWIVAGKLLSLCRHSEAASWLGHCLSYRHASCGFTCALPGSVRENITFGRPYDPVFYQQVITACVSELRDVMCPAAAVTEAAQ
jgi:hypothetical protein